MKTHCRKPFSEQRGARFPGRRAFTLMEVLTVMVIIAAMVTLILPVSQRVMDRSRAAHCMNNLRGLGAALQLYLGDHDNILPSLVTLRENKNDDQPAIDNTLNQYTVSLDPFHCIADTAGLWQTSGTSYQWNSLVNGQNVGSMNFMGLSQDGARIPLMSDKENFHKYQTVQVNILYADGHAAREIQFVTSSPK